MAQPMWRSISTIFSTEEVSRREEVTRFSTPRTTPSEVAIPMAVEPSLIASREYSTWKRRPSGEKVLIPRSGGGRMQLAQRFLHCLAVCWCIYLAACLFLVLESCSLFVCSHHELQERGGDRR